MHCVPSAQVTLLPLFLDNYSVWREMSWGHGLCSLQPRRVTAGTAPVQVPGTGELATSLLSDSSLGQNTTQGFPEELRAGGVCTRLLSRRGLWTSSCWRTESREGSTLRRSTSREERVSVLRKTAE